MTEENLLLALAAMQSERTARLREGLWPTLPGDRHEGLVVLAILLALATIYVLGLLRTLAAA